MVNYFSMKGPALLFSGALLMTTFVSAGASSPRVTRTSQVVKTAAIAPAGYNCSTTATAPYYCLGAENDSSVNGYQYGVYGLEGYAPYAAGSVGVLGSAGNFTTGTTYGVYGVTYQSNGIGVYGVGDGPSPAPDNTPGNTNLNTGVVGVSHNGDGVYGLTSFANPSNGFQIGGVVGYDTSLSGTSNNGVLGISTIGSGVAGTSKTGAGLYGESTEMAVLGAGGDIGVIGSGSGDGVVGYGHNGVAGQSSTDVGVYGSSSTAVGVEGINLYTGSASGADYTGVFGTSQQGYGAIAYSSNYIGAIVANDAQGPPIDTFVIDAQGNPGAYPLYVETGSSTPNGILSLDHAGNLAIAGTLTQSASLSTSNNPNSDLMSYSAQETEPLMEDVGSGQLINGSVTVPLAPDFSQTINGSSRYMVFLTPSADCNGLYVASRTRAGFVVRELRGGRSSIGFDYRIVAERYGARNGRLPHERVLDPNRFNGRMEAMAGGLSAKDLVDRLNQRQVLGLATGRKLTSIHARMHTMSATRTPIFMPRANSALEYPRK